MAFVWGIALGAVILAALRWALSRHLVAHRAYRGWQEGWTVLEARSTAQLERWGELGGCEGAFLAWRNLLSDAAGPGTRSAPDADGMTAEERAAAFDETAHYVRTVLDSSGVASPGSH
ncbi:hypothetical protein [Streptomonospora litoralis]|uniref:Uncharacterized protein n=1 Tax=Streptomonospora litoralis TaxID=2498135 RepID=A0A4V0ZKA8_9ACTN|nr:hypothetical protein [Streptomonospora litoralis]QBI56332.1 hypothetical protein EKD16_22895 [Streptomonospora litoralis]